jgi:hypothetical protein
MLDSFRDINGRVLHKDIDWIFLEVRPAVHTTLHTAVQTAVNLHTQSTYTCSCPSGCLFRLRHAAVASLHAPSSRSHTQHAACTACL